MLEKQLVDHVQSQENAEMEALLSLMSQDEQSLDAQQYQISDFGSDDDSMFLDALDEAEADVDGDNVELISDADLDPPTTMDTSMA